jgi:hypothetical protein
MSLYLLSQCLKAVPVSAFPALLAVINDPEAARPAQSLLTTFSHGCAAPRVRVAYSSYLTSLGLYGWTLGKYVPAVQAETAASQYYLTGTTTGWSESVDFTGYCGPYLDDNLNQAFTWTRFSNGQAGSTAWPAPYVDVNETHGRSNYLVWVPDFELEEGGSCQLDDTSVEGLYRIANMDTYTVSDSVGALTATATARSCDTFVNGVPVDFTIGLANELTEAAVIAAYTPVPAAASATTGTLATFADGTFALAGLLQGAVRSIWQMRAGNVGTFTYGAATFTLEGTGLMPGAQYGVNALIARRETVRSASEGSWTGAWSVHATPSWTFTATAATSAVFTTPYELAPAQGWETALVWAGLERL